MAGYILRHWRGELPVATSFFINFLALNIVISLASTAISDASYLEVAPYTAAALIILKLAIYLLVLTWQAVGLFRCAIKQPRVIIKSLIIVVVVAAVSNQAYTIYRHQQQFSSIAKLALRIDQLEAYQIVVDPGKKLISINGPFGIGIASQLQEALEQADYDIVILNSPGGYIYEGRSVARLIKRHQLSTTSTSGCSSICTLAFLAGKHRFLPEGANLGFHQYGSDFLSPESLINQQKVDMQTLAGYGIAEEFIERAYQVKGDRLWQPDHEELLNSGVLTQ